MRRQHPDALTPRERQVLDLIRRGLMNEEIAQRLGISLDGSKYHVSQILSKLGVGTREEAAAIALGERRRRWARWPLWAKIAAGATVLSAVAGVALLAWGVVRTEGDQEFPPVGLTDEVPQSPNYDRTILGRLVAIHEQEIVVLGFFRDADERFALQVTGDTIITKDGATASATDLRLGDTLSALVADSGEGKFIAASVHVQLPENVAGVRTPGPICIEDLTGGAIQPNLAQASIRDVFHKLSANEKWALNYGENEPQVDNGCPLPLPTLSAERVGSVPEMVLLPTYFHAEAASIYRWFVYLVSDDDLSRLVGGMGIQFSNQEALCEGDVCFGLSFRIFISASQLRDVVALTNVLECFAVECNP